MTSPLEQLIERNRQFAASGKHEGLSARGRHSAIVVTCFDPRVDPAHVLGIKLGDAVVVRNGGGRVTDDVRFQIALLLTMAEVMLDTEPAQLEVALIHHTRCGTQSLSEPSFRETLSDRTGVEDEQLAALAVEDPTLTVQSDVKLLRSWPTLPSWVTICGYVYDVNSGLVTPVDV